MWGCCHRCSRPRRSRIRRRSSSWPARGVCCTNSGPRDLRRRRCTQRRSRPTEVGVGEVDAGVDDPDLHALAEVAVDKGVGVVPGGQRLGEFVGGRRGDGDGRDRADGEDVGSSRQVGGRRRGRDDREAGHHILGRVEHLRVRVRSVQAIGNDIDMRGDRRRRDLRGRSSRPGASAPVLRKRRSDAGARQLDEVRRPVGAGSPLPLDHGGRFRRISSTAAGRRCRDCCVDH